MTSSNESKIAESPIDNEAKDKARVPQVSEMTRSGRTTGGAGGSGNLARTSEIGKALLAVVSRYPEDWVADGALQCVST